MTQYQTMLLTLKKRLRKLRTVEKSGRTDRSAHFFLAILFGMLFAAIIRDYFVWHYTTAWFLLWGVWRNFLWFVIHFFSLPQLMRSWLAPFKRITERRGDKFDLEDLASYVIIGFLSRIIGALVRTVIIVIGLITLALTVLGGFVVYLLWALVPFLIIGILGMSISLLLI